MQVPDVIVTNDGGESQQVTVCTTSLKVNGSYEQNISNGTAYLETFNSTKRIKTDSLCTISNTYSSLEDDYDEELQALADQV